MAEKKLIEKTGHNKKCGFVDEDGNWIVEPIFDIISYMGFVEGFCRVKLKGRWGYIKTDGSFLVEPKFDIAHEFNEGYALVGIERIGYGYLNTNGTYLVEPKFNMADDFIEGLARVCLNNKWGYIKDDGTWIVEPKFDEAEPFDYFWLKQK